MDTKFIVNTDKSGTAYISEQIALSSKKNLTTGKYKSNRQQN